MKWLKTIYKFMPLRKEFLENRLLRLTPRINLNDPYDSHPFTSDIEERKHLYPPYIPEASVEGHVTETHLNGIGVISFTEAIDNILMWSHYADSHKGMAIGFDPNHPFFKNLYRVRYTTQRVNLRREYPKTVGVELFFKSDQWMYEKEWRIIESTFNADGIFNTDTNDFIQGGPTPIPTVPPHLAMMRVPHEAIRSIAFGARTPPFEIDTFTSKIRTDPSLSHINQFRCKLNPDKYELNFEQII